MSRPLWRNHDAEHQLWSSDLIRIQQTTGNLGCHDAMVLTQSPTIYKVSAAITAGCDARADLAVNAQFSALRMLLRDCKRASAARDSASWQVAL